MVGDRTFEARRGVVLATGTLPSSAVPGLEGTPYWTNRGRCGLPRSCPRRCWFWVGAIGAELAQVFARFKCAVTVIEGQDGWPVQEEPEAGELAAEVLRADGVTVFTGARARQVSHDGTSFTVHLDGDEQLLSAERLPGRRRTPRRPDPTGVDTVGSIRRRELCPRTAATAAEGCATAITARAFHTCRCTRRTSPSGTSSAAGSRR